MLARRNSDRPASNRPALLAAAFIIGALAAIGCRSDRRPDRPAEDPHIAMVEAALMPAAPADWDRGWPLAERMEFWGVPGLSVAVVEDFDVVWEKAYGIADREQGRPATTATLFQAGSISKSVAAVGAMVQVEAGRIDLDAPINDSLRSWKVPDNELTAKTPVTLRQLMSHTAGTTVQGFPGYESWSPLPSLVEILDGRPPANTPPVRVDLPPGEQYRYSGGGITIAQLGIMDITGEGYPELLRRTVLGPMGLDHSTFDQPLKPDDLARAAAGYQANGLEVPGKRHTYPEMAAAGLWTTAGDLARFGAAMQRILRGDLDGVIRPATASMMLEPIHDDAGLGFFIEDRDGEVYFEHDGADEGFLARLLMHREAGCGVAVMVNSNGGWMLIGEVINAVAEVYGWRGYPPRRLVPIPVPPETLDGFSGRYEFRTDMVLTVARDEARLSARVTGWPTTLLVPVDEDVFVSQDDGVRIRFVRDEAGNVTGYLNPDRDQAELHRRLTEDEVAPVEYVEAGQVAESLAAYDPIAREDPDRVDRVALSTLRRGDPRVAIALLELNARLHSGDANLWDSLGIGYLALNRRTEALEAFHHVLDVMADYEGDHPDTAPYLASRAQIAIDRL